MVGRQSGVDWHAVRDDLAAGARTATVAKNHGVSRQTITERAQREGWDIGPKHQRAELARRQAATDGFTEVVRVGREVGAVQNKGRALSVPVQALPVEIDDAWRVIASKDFLALWQGDDVVLRQKALDVIVITGSEAIAAANVGLSIDVFGHWSKGCAVMARQVEMAHGHHTLKQGRNIGRAGDRGDWRASEALLKANRITRTAYATQGGAAAIGPAINIAIFDRGAPPPTAPARVVDVTPNDPLDVDFLQ
jgi:hypothetical protein